ncbi:type I toxin-antitoxin system toxin Ldr family protein [Escherichia coli]|nr:type I toxin-antitoxin system toxin Ldr family protein [Escherichia coli]
MTLAQFAMIFWHDLAAPILAGIITAASHYNKAAI